VSRTSPTHRQDTIERVPLDPHSGQARQTMAGKPFDEQLIGPSSIAWTTTTRMPVLTVTRCDDQVGGGRSAWTLLVTTATHRR
jgi:hypothetical protein